MTDTPIFLCGYTSSGKSTIGRLLADRLSLPFYDTDQLLLKETGMSPQELFSTYGEDRFRELEHETARRVSDFGPCVVSTGGGMLTFPRNGELLSAHGTVIYIDRPFEDCYRNLMATPDRPLIRNNTKEELLARYNTRAATYKKYAVFSVKNNGTPEDAVNQIISILKNRRS